VTPKARETSLQKRLAYLGIADFDYLSARVLMRHGLAFTGLAKASDAFEKIMKLNLILDAKISRNQDLEPDEVKTYLHNLRGLLDDFEDHFPQGPPSLRNAERLVVEGDFTFGRGVVVRGSVELRSQEPRRIEDAAVLAG